MIMTYDSDQTHHDIQLFSANYLLWCSYLTHLKTHQSGSSFPYSVFDKNINNGCFWILFKANMIFALVIVLKRMVLSLLE